MVEAEGLLTEFRAQVEMHGGLIHNHMVQLGELSPALFERYDGDIGELFTRSETVKDEEMKVHVTTLEKERDHMER
nr:hypothetical protein [Tanacetum cinerariifolium]